MAGVTSDGRLNVAMIGYSFMGRAHAQAWSTVGRHFDLPVQPHMKVVVGRSAEQVEEARAKLGFEEAATDWREVVARDDIDIVDICTPGNSHHEIAIAALEAGKHVMCEKPLANTVEEAQAMADAAAKARVNGVRSMVAFNYRRVPALAHAKQLVEQGVIGEIRHIRAVYLQDWIVDPEFPLVWRLQSDLAGSGALGDIGAHIIDLAQHLTGATVTELTGHTHTFVTERPLAEGSDGLSATGSGGSGDAGAEPPREMGPVTVDDAALVIARMSDGALATFEASRFATGRKNGLRIELNGSKGSIVFDLERLNELELFTVDGTPATEGFRRILVTEGDQPYMAAWWPPGHIIGWEHSFVHEVRDFAVAIAEGTDPQPGFAEGLQVQHVLDAVQAASDQRGWVSVAPG